MPLLAWRLFYEFHFKLLNDIFMACFNIDGVVVVVFMILLFIYLLWDLHGEPAHTFSR